jgi:hypothetical protein
VAFTTQHRPPNQPRVEDGSRGAITHIDHQRNQAIVTLDGSDRQITLQGDDLETLRLAYAEHIYRKQGATVERSVVLTGGWQTSKESSYVEASRARHGTDWYFSREDLGTNSHDTDRTTRLAERMRDSRAQTPSLTYETYSTPRTTSHTSPGRQAETPSTTTSTADADRLVLVRWNIYLLMLRRGLSGR